MRTCKTCQANLPEIAADGCPCCGGTTFAVRVEDTVPIALEVRPPMAGRLLRP
jgi:hypothetical protein